MNFSKVLYFPARHCQLSFSQFDFNSFLSRVHPRMLGGLKPITPARRPAAGLSAVCGFCVRDMKIHLQCLVFYINALLTWRRYQVRCSFFSPIAERKYFAFVFGGGGEAKTVWPTLAVASLWRFTFLSLYLFNLFLIYVFVFVLVFLRVQYQSAGEHIRLFKYNVQRIPRQN